MSNEPQQKPEGFWHHVLTIPNLVSVLAGLLVFWVIADNWQSKSGTLSAAIIGSLITAIVWIAWMRIGAAPRLDKAMDEPVLAYVPTTEGSPTPILADPDSDAARVYIDAVRSLEQATKGQVIMVTSSSPGLGATTVAINLAIAATRMGRRAVLIDGDPGGGLSEYGRSSSVPGWVDLATGEADLRGATRFWKIDDANTLPVIPVGSTVEDRKDILTSLRLADTVDTLTEQADLLIINTAPLAWDENIDALATHADGTLLVVTPEVDPRSLAKLKEKLAEMAAPVIGYVVNHAERSPDSRPLWQRSTKRMITTFVLLLFVYSSWNLYSAWYSWNSVERHSFDEVALDKLPAVPPPEDSGETFTPEAATAVTATPSETGRYLTFMVVGSDVGGYRADVIILVMLPTDGSDPIMVSLPRDLYLPNRCTQTYTRLNANFNGCGSDINGATLLSAAVKDFTGVEVDHFALFDFDGFKEIIDEVGGVEICVDYPVRDRKSRLNLPAGCTNASGEQALAWVRSRNTLEYVNGSWRTMPNVSDLTRNQRQQDMILTMLEKAAEFDSPRKLAGVVRSVSNAFTLDDKLSLTDAINLAWDLRGLNRSDIVQLKIPVENYRTADGAQVLLPTEPFHTLLDEYLASAPGDDTPK
jgi:LCP family protein required for cell wall assembly